MDFTDPVAVNHQCPLVVACRPLEVVLYLREEHQLEVNHLVEVLLEGHLLEVHLLAGVLPFLQEEVVEHHLELMKAELRFQVVLQEVIHLLFSKHLLLIVVLLLMEVFPLVTILPSVILLPLVFLLLRVYLHLFLL